MNTIKLNNVTCEVLSYNKTTTFNNGEIYGSGGANIRTDDISALQELGLTTIDAIQIFHDEEKIYDLTNAGGKITSIDEYLSENTMNINVNFAFTPMIAAEEEPTASE